jgi:hypothetical protein
VSRANGLLERDGRVMITWYDLDLDKQQRA